MRLFFFILLFSVSALAYSPKDLDVTAYEYSRYVRPQLRSIVQDYKTLLFVLNPDLKPLKESFSINRKLIQMEYSLKDKCYIREGSTCFSDLEKISELLKNLKKSSYNKINFNEIKNITLDQKINAQNKFNSFYQEITKAEIDIDNFIMEAKLLTPKFLYTKKIKFQISNIATAFDIFILQATDDRFQNDFTTYWSSFIKPIYINVIIRNKKEYFLKNINELNIRWNALNVRLTKRNIPIPKQAKTLLNIMHNRWNNILKVTLITNPKR